MLFYIIYYLFMYTQSHTLPQHKSNLCKILLFVHFIENESLLGIILLFYIIDYLFMYTQSRALPQHKLNLCNIIVLHIL